MGVDVEHTMATQIGPGNNDARKIESENLRYVHIQLTGIALEKQDKQYLPFPGT